MVSGQLTQPAKAFMTVVSAGLASVRVYPNPWQGDKNGITRGADGTWDRGAYEVVLGAQSPLNPPLRTIYLDQRLSANCTTSNYSIANRNCSGTGGNAYKTLSDIASVEKPGDRVLIREGTYTNSGPLALLVDGTADHAMTWKNYPGESPVLQAEIYINGHHYRRFEGENTLNRLILDGTGTLEYGFYQNGGSANNLLILNVEILNYFRNGIYLNRAPQSTIDGSTIHHIGDNIGETYGHGDCVVWSGASENSEIKNSEVSYCQDDGLTINGQTVLNNIIHQVQRVPGGIAHPDCIEGAGTVIGNTIYDCGNAGIITGINQNLIAANNVFYRSPTWVSNDSGNWWIQLLGVKSANIYNNTLYNSKTGGIRILADDTGTNSRNVVIKNNILSGSGVSTPPISVAPGSEQGFESDYNLFHGMDSGSPNIIADYELKKVSREEMCSSYSQECHSISGRDPLFSDALNHVFTLTANSPGKDAGIEQFSTFATDRNGVLRVLGSTWDMGAFEFESSFSIPPLVKTGLESVNVYPNPWRSDKHEGNGIIFDSLPLNTTIKIFTIAGEHVVTLPIQEDKNTWDLKDKSGENIASGVYAYASQNLPLHNLIFNCKTNNQPLDF